VGGVKGQLVLWVELGVDWYCGVELGVNWGGVECKLGLWVELRVNWNCGWS
jgi:hypothetical protein